MQHQDTETAQQRGSRLVSGRKFNADELQLMLLWLLRDGPAYGYQFIQRFGELSGGYYQPSPGVLYPALKQLEMRGHTQSEHSGKRKIYRLTETGRRHSESHDEQSRMLLAILKHAAKKMLWMSQSRISVAAAAKATGWLPEFIQARKDLQAALLAESDPDHAEQRRIIAILRRAVKEILKK